MRQIFSMKNKFYCWHADATSDDACKEQCTSCKGAKFTQNNCEKIISIPEYLFDELIDYFDNKADADGSSEGYIANKEMKLLSQLQSCKPHD